MKLAMNMILVVQMLSAIGMVGLILVQHGKGADMGAAFGSGSSGSLFGASGSANFLSRATAVLAAVFFATTLALAYFANSRPASSGSVLGSPAAIMSVPRADESKASDTPPAADIPKAASESPPSGAAAIPTK
jgi:preprotein translocase subunit SecG